MDYTQLYKIMSFIIGMLPVWPKIFIKINFSSRGIKLMRGPKKKIRHRFLDFLVIAFVEVTRALW